MTDSLTRERAGTAIRTALRGFATDAEVAALKSDENIREAFELDSLDFLTFVERLSTDLGVRIDEDDYRALSTMDSTVAFLTARG
ncbi:phosphopantetheine-binding protein [Amycolatopsis orientalis]|uniref:phosphopantetheine-binding protein n=1 Tax=Amycolatopsis orientalis TaxID=31958 RepID=UPI00040B8E93|nr:phosphopantetheine-binding protein [Amycolatopsis orientalis]